jgi:hypothetical protein
MEEAFLQKSGRLHNHNSCISADDVTELSNQKLVLMDYHTTESNGSSVMIAERKVVIQYDLLIVSKC